VPVGEVESRYLGLALSLAPQAETAADPDTIETRNARVGLHWFVPELLKHRRVWRDVLLASLVLQLIGLALPLFTQVIIDKVVVHRTQSTLIALGIAMVVFMLFTSVLTWVRQYLILHTGQRIDAVLSSQVFDRLFKLPLLYFQHRPTGVISARLQGIENIREFIASAAVTVALDIPFLLIFVAIMFWYSVSLTLLVLGILALVVGASLLVVPLFRERLNEQFRRGAANQAFLTEYVAGIETVKSLRRLPRQPSGDQLVGLAGLGDAGRRSPPGRPSPDEKERFVTLAAARCLSESALALTTIRPVIGTPYSSIRPLSESASHTWVRMSPSSRSSP